MCERHVRQHGAQDEKKLRAIARSKSTLSSSRTDSCCLHIKSHLRSARARSKPCVCCNELRIRERYCAAREMPACHNLRQRRFARSTKQALDSSKLARICDCLMAATFIDTKARNTAWCDANAVVRARTPHCEVFDSTQAWNEHANWPRRQC